MFSSEAWLANPSSGFYNGVATQSLRCDSASNPKLVLDGTSGNRKTWTWSCWVKRSALGSAQIVFNVGVTGVDEIDFHFTANDEFIISDRGGHNLKTAQLFRDTSAWYNLVVVMDTEQSGVTFSSANALKLYVNGVRVTDYGSGTSLPDEDDEFSVNHTRIHHIATRNLGDNDFDGYLAEMNLVDGIAVGETNGYLDEFGEVKNGVWIPKKYTGAYGNNGFRLQFKETGLGTGSTSTIGADTANSNHFDSSGIVASDCAMPDSPENNFCTLNTLDKVLTSSALSEGNLSVSAGTGNAWNNIINSTFSLTSGKWYWEVYQNGTAGFGKIGVRQNNSLTSADSHSAGASEVYLYNGNKQQGATSTDSAYYGSQMYTGGNNIFGIALDMDAGKIWVAKANAYGGSADPTTGNGAMFTNLTEPQSPSFSSYNMATIFNFGQDDTFAGNKTSGSANAQDANGNGEFYYAPPSGFLAICSANLPEITISPNADTQAVNHFGTLLYTGDGNSTQNIRSGASGIGGEIDFKPDFTWTKGRIVGNSHLLYDSSRGAGASKGLKANDTAVEGENDNSTYGYLSSFETNGFNVAKGSTTSYSFMNQNTKTLVAWNWKAGGATPTKTYKVVVVSDSGNKYRFRNSADSATFAQSAVALNLQEGGTYTFDYSDSTATSHPFRFSTTSDGTHGGGSEYTTGVVKDDTAKTITITVASSAPTLYYYCSAHSGMGGQVNTNTTSGQTNFDGSVLSVSNANTDAGFSIVTYSANNSAGDTVGHGLGVAPKMVIVKKRNVAERWFVWHTGDSTEYMYLNETFAGQANLDDRFGNNTTVTLPSSTVLTLGTNNDVNGASGTYVAYCFAEVEGYSKFGSFTGNTSADGTFVALNFSPAMVIVKRVTGSSTYDWFIHDNKRGAFNVNDERLAPNVVDIESTSITSMDFLSNGFKIRTSNTSYNEGTVIYMAFAEVPFKYALAR